MPRRSKRTKTSGIDGDVNTTSSGGNNNNNNNNNNNDAEDTSNSVAAHVRERQRAVAEREASRLARPERSRRSVLAHADKKLSGVSSTPFGFLAKPTRSRNDNETGDDHQEGWCGPFSVARRMIAEREEAKLKREEELEEEQQKQQARHPLDALMEEVNEKNEHKIHPSMQWKSNLKSIVESDNNNNNNGKVVVTSSYAKRKRRVDLSKMGKSRILPLFTLTVNFIVDNFEHVEALGDVGNEVRLAIAKELAGRNELDGPAFEALVEPCGTMETLEIIDCAAIPQDTMASVLKRTTSLRYLLLTHAGRCFGTKSVKALLPQETAKKSNTTDEAAPKQQLCCLSIAGAYLFRDEDAAKLIKAHGSTLQSLSFKSCPLLGNDFFHAIHSISGGEYLLELSLADMSFSADQLTILADSKDTLKGIRSLTLVSIVGLTDQVLVKILEHSGGSLDTLDISFNRLLTDATLSSIRKHSGPNLKTLALDGNRGFTPAGLEALFTHALEGLPAPPKLKVLKLASIDPEAVTDELLGLVTAGSSATTVSTTAGGLATSALSSRYTGGGYRGLGRSGGLVKLDVKGSTLVTDRMLERLVETSANTLETLCVSYCPLISDKGLGYLISRLRNQLTKIEVWGCAQLTDDFFDGHDRVEDGTLEIIGAWIKKSGVGSLR